MVEMTSKAQLSPADFKYLVEQAVKAPSGHNTQPWLFRQKGMAVEIHPDFSRALKVVDASHRELFISLGCAAENICLAAHANNYEVDVATSDAGVITISLARRTLAPDPLFNQIDKRQTNRSVYSGEMIPPETLTKLQSVYIDDGVLLHYYARGTTQFSAIERRVLEGDDRQMQNEDFKIELKGWMRFNKKHQDQTLDGLSYAVFGAPNVPRRLAELIMSGAINAKSQNKADRRKLVSASHLVLFTTRDNELREWVNLGRTLQRFLLAATSLGVVHSYFNQPNEEAEVAEAMAKDLGLDGEYPTILLRIGYGKPQPYSKRRSIEEVVR